MWIRKEHKKEKNNNNEIINEACFFISWTYVQLNFIETKLLNLCLFLNIEYDFLHFQNVEYGFVHDFS
jgi:hypothetical protein